MADFDARDIDGCKFGIAKLAELDVWVRQQMEAVPKDKRMAITAHDAFGYFAKAYGMRFIPAQGITAEGQPSAAGLAQLIDQIKAGHVSVIFLENMENKQLAEQLADETGAVIGGELYAETLTSPQSEGGDYISLMRHNVRVLAAALQK